jgi:MFS family permease
MSEDALSQRCTASAHLIKKVISLSISVSQQQKENSVLARLLPILLVVFVLFLLTGLALPVLPLHVHQRLGQSNFVVGLVSGSQFAASLICRVWSGQFSDTRGAKGAVIVGLIAAIGAGILYLISLHFLSNPGISVAFLLTGRAMLGGAESFITTGGLSWALMLVDAQSTGKVMSWVGTAMYAALTLGAPLGSALYVKVGFIAIGLATAIVPLFVLLFVAQLQRVSPQNLHRPSMLKVLSAVWLPGVGLALSSLGFGAITAFIGLLFVERGWPLPWLPFSAFAGSFMVARILFGHLPDQLGGARVALACVLIEGISLAIVWLAPTASVAISGAVLTGLGYSLVYPGLGIEAVRRARAQSRGLAMGAYTAFLDLALGLAVPALGLVGNLAGLNTVFLVSSIAVLCSGVVSAYLLKS